MACAGAANVYLMRFKETRVGITVTDKDGNALGVSKKAGTKAVNLTALTRVILPTPGKNYWIPFSLLNDCDLIISTHLLVLLLPPFIIDGLRAMHCVPAGKWGNIITQLGRKIAIKGTNC